MTKHSGAAPTVTGLPNWRFRFPPYHYGVTDNGSAQVRQASVDGRLLVNSLSGNVSSGLPGRVTGVATVGMEVTAYAPPFVAEPWGEVCMRLNLLVFGPEGFSRPGI